MVRCAKGLALKARLIGQAVQQLPAAFDGRAESRRHSLEELQARWLVHPQEGLEYFPIMLFVTDRQSGLLIRAQNGARGFPQACLQSVGRGDSSQGPLFIFELL